MPKYRAKQTGAQKGVRDAKPDPALTHNRLGRFRSENLDLEWFFPGVGMIHFIEENHHISMFVELREETSKTNMLKALPEIMTWRQRLIKFQGPWMQGGPNVLYERLLDRHEAGIPGKYSTEGDYIGRIRPGSYEDLARGLNRSFNEDLKSYLNDRRLEAEAAKQLQGQPVTVGQWRSWQFEASKTKDYRYSLGLHHAKTLLAWMRIPQAEIESCCRDALDPLQNKVRLVDPMSGPITREHVINVLKQWRRKRMTV